MRSGGAVADDRPMAPSIARAFRVATEATLSTLAVLAAPPAAVAHGADAQANACGGGSVNASSNRAR